MTARPEAVTPPRPETPVILTTQPRAASRAFVEGKPFQSKDGVDAVLGGRMGTPVIYTYDRATIVSREPVRAALATVREGIPKTEHIRARLNQVFEDCGRTTRLLPGWQVKVGAEERDWDDARDSSFTCRDSKEVPPITPSPVPAAERVPPEANQAARAFVAGQEFSEGIEKVTVKRKVLYTYGPHVIASRPSAGREITTITLPGDIPREEEARTRLNAVLEMCNSETRVRVVDKTWKVQDGQKARDYVEHDSERTCPNALEVPVVLVKHKGPLREGTFGSFCKTPKAISKNQDEIIACSLASPTWNHDYRACDQEMEQLGFEYISSGMERSTWRYGDCAIKIAKGMEGAQSNAGELHEISELPRPVRKHFIPIQDHGPDIATKDIRDQDPVRYVTKAYPWTTAPFIAAGRNLPEGVRAGQLRNKLRGDLDEMGVECTDIHEANVGLYEGRPVVIDAGALYGKKHIKCSARGRVFFAKLFGPDVAWGGPVGRKRG